MYICARWTVVSLPLYFIIMKELYNSNVSVQSLNRAI